MSEKKNENPFWGYIGKAGVIIALIWGSIQIYNNFFKTGDFDAIAEGNHSFYETSPLNKTAYVKNAEYKSLVRTIIEKDGSLKDYHLDSLLEKIKSEPKSNLKLYFDSYLITEGVSEYSNNEYNSIWVFRIKNSGNRPLEELALELPFSGICKIILPNNIVKTNNFKSKIDIGELRPSYEANIYCWTNNSYGFSEGDEDKSRFTHKYGWFGITYPIEVTGIYAWNKKLYDFPLIFFVGLFFVLPLISYAYGELSMANKIKFNQERNSESKVTPKAKEEIVTDPKNKTE